MQKGGKMRLIDADRLLEEKRKGTYYHLPNGDIAIPIIDIERAPTIAQPEPCEDAVSRQAAIDAALSAFSRGLLASPDIRRLPSVTPISLPECEDTVSRAKLQEKLQWIIDHGLPSSDGKHNLSAECVLEYVNSLPFVTPEPKTGRWIEYIPEHGKCPFCGNQVDLMDGRKHSYCGECGAKMEGRDAVN